MSEPSSGELRIPLSVQLAVYATGTFGNTINNVVTVLIPLWALHLGASPLMTGLMIGARHFLTTIFSIHGGALMDRLGTRRVLIWFALIGAVTPFPSLLHSSRWISFCRTCVMRAITHTRSRE